MEFLVAEVERRGGNIFIEMRDRAGTGIGSIAGERLSSHASAICSGVAL